MLLNEVKKKLFPYATADLDYSICIVLELDFEAKLDKNYLPIFVCGVDEY